MRKMIYIFMKNKQSKKMHLFVCAIIMLLGGGLFLISNNNTKDNSIQVALDVQKPRLTVYKSSTCGCCDNYVSYLKREKYDVEVVETDDVDSIKQKYGVPMDKSSCHTTVVGDDEYVIEGHVPVQAISQLLAQKPNVLGIGMAGMPGGSPGMPGVQRVPFDIYSFDDTGVAVSFMTL